MKTTSSTETRKRRTRRSSRRQTPLWQTASHRDFPTATTLSHRLSTIRDADVIIVLKDGVIAEAGAHETLIKQGGEYSALYNKQSAGIVT